MGLDASVMCRCWAEGRTKPPPCDPAELHVDEDGYLSLIGARRDDEKLQDALWAWEETACEHPGMDAASERISNWSGYRQFQEALAHGGGFMFGGPTRTNVGFDEHGLFVEDRDDGERLFHARRFRQVIVERRRWLVGPREKVVRLTDIDTGDTCIAPMPIAEGSPRIVHVEKRLRTGADFDYILDPLRMVFRASVATGNPVRWC